MNNYYCDKCKNEINTLIEVNGVTYQKKLIPRYKILSGDSVPVKFDDEGNIVIQNEYYLCDNCEKISMQ